MYNLVLDEDMAKTITNQSWLRRWTRRVLCISLKTLASILLLATTAVVITSVSPIYNAKAAEPFKGPDIYDPYRDLDTTTGWKRANFHTHTRVEGILNECEEWPDKVLEAYEPFGYEIVTFSNHNELTEHPTDPALQVDLYEHGYNLFKYHKLVFGASKTNLFDHLLPLFASQKQFQINLLMEDADIIQLNHPLRTPTLSHSQLKKLSGYRLMELDSGKSTENRYWDAALSAGRYSFGLANDDLHHPDESHLIAVRCNFLCTPSARYEDILATLNKGCFYAMRVPDYGYGDWALKREMNSHLPYIEDIGMRDSVVYIRLSEPAALIEITGTERTPLATVEGCDSLSYAMCPDDPYVRITAHFPDGEVIYTNPFARYDASVADSPFDDELPKVNLPLTILFNLALVAIWLLIILLYYNYIIKGLSCNRNNLCSAR